MPLANDHPDETVTLALDRAHIVHLFCNLLHQTHLARKAMNEGNAAAAVARYFSADRGEASELFSLLPEDLRTEIIDAVANANEGGK